MNLPEIDFDYSWLYQTVNAPVKSKILKTAIEFKIFDLLTRPLAVPEISAALGTHPQNTTLFLDALAACNFVTKQNGVYRNTKAAENLLITDKPACLNDWFSSQMSFLTDSLDKLPELLKNGPPAKIQEEDMNSEAMCESFTSAHAKWQLAGYAKLVAARLSKIKDFPLFRCMLDLGGGPGILTIATLSLNSHMRGVVFDRKGVTSLAQRYSEQYGMKDRIRYAGDDYFEDDLGEDYDLIVASDTLYYPPEKATKVIDKVYQALNTDGIFVGIHASLSRERTSPENLATGMLLEGMMDRGSLPDSGFLLPLMSDAGFGEIETETLLLPSGGFFELNIGRKING